MSFRALLALAAAAAAARQKVVIVADVGVDDAAALLWAAGRPDLFELLIVGASFGSHPDPRVATSAGRAFWHGAAVAVAQHR